MRKACLTWVGLVSDAGLDGVDSASRVVDVFSARFMGLAGCGLVCSCSDASAGAGWVGECS